MRVLPHCQLASSPATSRVSYQVVRPQVSCVHQSRRVVPERLIGKGRSQRSAAAWSSDRQDAAYPHSSRKFKSTPREGVAEHVSRLKTLAVHAWAIGPSVLWRMLIAFVQHLRNGPYAAVGMTGVTATDYGKAVDVSICSAQLVHLGFGMAVARMCVACLRLGHTQQVIQGAVVLAKRKEWEVLLAGLDCIADIGAEDEAAVIRDALAEQGLDDFIEGVTNQPIAKLAKQAKRQVKKATATTAATAAALSKAVKGPIRQRQPRTSVDTDD